MDPSPQGRDIEYVDGSPSGIISRGEAITRLGRQMRRSAEILDGIKNNSLDSGGQVGKAIDELSSKIGDSYKTLYEAADLYEPVGPVITAYGEDLESVQPLIKSAVDESEDLWATYDSLPGDAEGSTTPEAGGGFLGMGGYDADSPEAEEAASDNAAKKAAYEAWEARAKDFDAHYDTWESAFDTAVTGITDGMSEGIEDGFWDYFDATVAFLKNVVDIAALVVGVIALFAGGWVLALAAVLALAVLALTFVQYKRGNASGWDLAFAALGVVPFGKITTVTKLMAVKKLAGTGETWGAVKNVLKMGPAKILTDLGIARAPRTLANATDPTLANKLGFVGRNKVLEGYETALGRQISRREAGSVSDIATVEQYAAGTGAVLNHYGRVQTFANNDWNPWTPDLYKVPPALRVFV